MTGDNVYFYRSDTRWTWVIYMGYDCKLQEIG